MYRYEKLGIFYNSAEYRYGISTIPSLVACCARKKW